MGEIQNLEFRSMSSGQGEAIQSLVLQAAKTSEKDGFTPAGRTALERYAAPEALERRESFGYFHELVYVSDVLAGMIELAGPDRISMLYIHPDYANKGLGLRLISRAASRCTELAPKIKHMTVHAVDDAIPFYERAGFVRSGTRKENGGVFSTPYKLELSAKGKIVSAKLHASSADLFVFTGTGNSLFAARTVSEVLNQEGLPTHLHSMDEPYPALGEATAIGLAFPVACFSTYPSVWRFIDSMPSGEGREIFMLGTCGGAPGGVQGPLRRILIKKGYKPVAAQVFVMPGNYGNKTLPLEKNAARVEKTLLQARSFAHDLLKGGMGWSQGIPLLSELMYRLGRTRMPWNAFYKWFPINVNKEKCIHCKRCADNCPAKAISMEPETGIPQVNSKLCESCQRCIGFCPTGAMCVLHKPAEAYRAMTYEEYRASFR